MSPLKLQWRLRWLSAQQAYCEGNLSITCDSPRKGQIMGDVDISVDICLNKLPSQQTRGRWHEMCLRPFDVTVMPTEFHDTIHSMQSRTKCPDSKVRGVNMEPIRGRQDLGGPHVGPMNFAISVDAITQNRQNIMTQYVHFVPYTCLSSFFIHVIPSRKRCYNTVTSWWARLRLKSPASPLFTQSVIQAQIKENIKAPRHWPLCGELTGDRWIPRTSGQ